jgi:hypothetical protein
MQSLPFGVLVDHDGAAGEVSAVGIVEILDTAGRAALEVPGPNRLDPRHRRRNNAAMLNRRVLLALAAAAPNDTCQRCPDTFLSAMS